MSRRKIVWWILPVALVLVGTLLSRGQNPGALSDPTVQQLENQLDRFFAEVGDGQIDDAFEELLADSPMLRGSKTIGELKERAKELEGRFGRLRGTERLSAHRVGQDLVIFKYLYKCEGYPVVWYFTFYRTLPPGAMVAATPTWTLIALRFDTQIELLDLTH